VRACRTRAPRPAPPDIQPHGRRPRRSFHRSAIRAGTSRALQRPIEAQLMRLLVVAGLLLVTLGSVAAAEAPVSVAATVDKRGITIGDPITLTLVVEADAGYQVTDSGVGRIMDEFEVLEAIPPQVTKIASGRTRYTFRYRVTAFRIGDLVFPQINVSYKSP